VYEREREKKNAARERFLFCSKEAACTHLMYVCMCVYMEERKKSACACSRSDNENVTILRKEKKREERGEKEPCPYGC
jgi:hypothetical protein